MELHRAASCVQVRQTTALPNTVGHWMSPSWGGAFPLPALPPRLTRVRKGLSVEAGALPPPRRLRASARPLL
jgi:hypothetical protein